MTSGGRKRSFSPAALFFTAIATASCLFCPSIGHASYKDLLRNAKDHDPKRYEYAVSHGAEIQQTEGAKSFYIYWAPENYQPSKGILVTLHGHGSYAFDEFFLWKSALEKRGMAILALQWWTGQGEATEDYLMPEEMYAEIERILRRKKTRPQKAILHGFSRGSANSYPVAALDQSSGNHFFKGIIANAGGASLDYFPVKKIDLGMHGPEVFKGTEWVLYCGGQDPNPERDGCVGMRRTKQWLEKHGARVAHFIQDFTAGHGGFHRNPRRVEEALSKFVL